MKKKSKTVKAHKNIKLEIHGWNTSDADEIARRRIRGQSEKFQVEMTKKDHPYFGCFNVRSKQDRQYHVEIRCLNEHINSCDCPDYQSNHLGTCKHIEHMLFRLQKQGKKKFKQMQLQGSNRIEIFLDVRQSPVIRMNKPKKYILQKYIELTNFFSTDGTLLDNPVSAFPILHQTILMHKKWRNVVRVSRHVNEFVARQHIINKKQVQKQTFLLDVQQGKQTLNPTKCNLYSYQQEGMLHLAFNERALLADEMGLGKTVQAIAACVLLHRQCQAQRILVVATASLKAEWEEQINKFTDLPSLIIQGTRAERLKQYQRPSFFYLANYEQIVMDYADIQRLLAPDVVILDEAQRIKNWQTKTANVVKQLKSRYAFVLTGTPLENRIDDIYSIVQFLDPHLFGALFRFNRKFYELDEKGKAIGYKNLDELHRMLRPIMLRRRKSDVEGQLPARTIKNYFVSMENEQQIRYEEYQNRVARILSHAKRRALYKEEMDKLQKWLACMRMICDSPYILDVDCRISPKLNELENILEDLLIDKSNKIIIFSEWERMLHLVRESVQKKQVNVAWHTGTVIQHKRREEINRFKNDENCRLFLSTDSGSVGLNLQAANVVINLDLPWNPAKLEQRIARAWRKHQSRSVQVINLVCENSIEHRMLHILAEKQTLAQGVLEGKDDLRVMKLPSGRAAFLQQVESLMGTALHTVPVNVATKITENNLVSSEIIKPVFQPKASQAIRAEMLAQFPAQISLLQTHQHTESKQPTMLAVVDKSSAVLEQQLKAHIENENISLEVIDHDTFTMLQRLIKAGIVTLNQPAELLYAAPEFAESRKQSHHKKITQAKKSLEQAEHKQRMAQVLIAGDFHQEAISPLHDALKLTVHSFACLTANEENIKKDIISPSFIKQHLLFQGGLPEKALLLWTQLEHSTEKNNNAVLSKLFSEHQEIFHHVDTVLNEAILSLKKL
ncbi:MAG TPA: DEAD/DEAH box helicase [Gammaproteobacteria bacterium]|nr:DEAD/DEAH box helicase [Gammaproteobacteria bacterium]